MHLDSLAGKTVNYVVPTYYAGNKDDEQTAWCMCVTLHFTDGTQAVFRPSERYQESNDDIYLVQVVEAEYGNEGE
jgi:hypothetical protein